MGKELLKMLKTSTAYGVPNLVKSKRIFNKLFWICFLVLSSSASFYFIYLVEYLSYDVVTIVKTEYDQSIEFPTVTFCSLTKGYFDNYSLSQMVTKESRYGYELSINEDTNNLFNFFISAQYGRCYSFNNGKNMNNKSIPIKNSTIGGRNDCFGLIMNISCSLIIWIHHRTSSAIIETYNNHDSPIFIQNGTKTYISIEKTVFYKLGEPYNHCIKDAKLFQGNKTIIDSWQCMAGLLD